MDVVFQLHIDHIPQKDQYNTRLISYLEKQLANGKIKHRSSVNVIELHIQTNNTQEEVLDILKIMLKNTLWSNHMYWNDHKVLCSRPIKSIFISYNNKILSGEILGIILTDHKVEFNDYETRLDLLKNQLCKFNIDNMEFMEKNISIVNKPKLIPITINKYGLEDIVIEFILREHFFSLLQDSYALCVFEENSIINENALTNNINARIKDYKLLIDMDLDKTLDNYIEKNHNKIINRDIGSIIDEQHGVYILLNNILDNNLTVSMKNYMKYYRISICSNIVQEDFQLEHYMTNKILEHNNIICNLTSREKNIIELSRSIFILNKLVSAKKTFNGKKDPFGFRKNIKNIINNIKTQKLLFDNKIFGNIIELINKSIKIDPTLNNVQICDKVHIMSNEKIFLKLYKRVSNLIKKIRDYNMFPSNTIEFQNLTSIKIMEHIDFFNTYIDQHRIIDDTIASNNIIILYNTMTNIINYNNIT